MKATIWHNPKCGTSRSTLALLQARPGLELEVIEYLKHPPAPARLAQLFRAAGIAPREGLRLRGTDAEARGLTTADDDTVLAAMAAEPSLIERPLVETERVSACAARRSGSKRFFNQPGIDPDRRGPLPCLHCGTLFASRASHERDAGV